MKYSLLKYKLLSKPFASSLKINKFANLSSGVKIDPIKIPDDFYQPEKHGLDTTAPKPGETYPLPVVNSKLIALEQGYTKAFERQPVSSYYSMRVKDKMYHVFNAARISLGQMGVKIAHIIQGKASPHYRPNKVDKTNICIIVNASNTWLTGKKLDSKLYRHHTGYPGGLKEIKARHYLEKNPAEMILRTIKGMIPKNKMRREFIKQVKIFNDGGHPYSKLGLPQFGKIIPVDYNEVFGLNSIRRGEAEIVSSNIPDKDMPDFLKNLKRRDPALDENQPKTVVNERMKIKFEKYTRRWRYRQYRNIRNKAYRYI